MIDHKPETLVQIFSELVLVVKLVLLTIAFPLLLIYLLISTSFRAEETKAGIKVAKKLKGIRNKARRAKRTKADIWDETTPLNETYDDDIESDRMKAEYFKQHPSPWVNWRGEAVHLPNYTSRERSEDVTQISLPQGSPLSPYLSILSLAFILNDIEIPKSVKFIFYADDGIFYSDNEEELQRFIISTFGTAGKVGVLDKYGIYFNAKKSGWAKIKGEWKYPLKFLGLVYHPTEDGFGRLVAATRSGKSTLVFDKDELVAQSYIKRLLSPDNNKEVVARLKKIESYKLTPATEFYTWLYKSILIYQSTASESETQIGSFDYAYLISKILTSGISYLFYFITTGAYKLEDKASLASFIKHLNGYPMIEGENYLEEYIKHHAKYDKNAENKKDKESVRLLKAISETADTEEYSN
jgi:hypothetical protein